MCSRYFLDADGNIIAYTFRVPVKEPIRKRFNIAPTQEAPVVRVREDGEREVALLRWGLVPAWAKEIGVGNKMINARCEGIEAKPSFRAAVRTRRCLVPATGFFEWKGIAGQKQPFAITLPDRPLFAFAGLWETWKPREGAAVETFTIVTTDANEAVGEVHDRMPVILHPQSEDVWLSGEPVEACKLLTPYSGPVNLRAVSRVVSNSKVDVPECLNDAEPGWGAQQSLL